MSPEQFRKWRKALDLKQREVAELLGLKKRMIQYYETGKRDGKTVKIPRSVRLACHALSRGIRDFDGEAVTRVPDSLAPRAGHQVDPGKAGSNGARCPSSQESARKQAK